MKTMPYQISADKKICVIGAGASGLTAIKCCLEEDLYVVCYEKNDSFGGVWRYHADDEEGKPSVMKSTVINTSKEMSAFSDFPPPEQFANYMHNSYMMQYFTMYAKKFNLLNCIKYKHDVVNVEMTEDYETTGKWQVTIKNLDGNFEFQGTFDGVMVCAGHHVYPYIPRFEGLNKFRGRVIHTHSLKTSEGFDDKTVLVIGIGNSAVDAAVEISKVSRKLYLSTERGSWIFPRLGPNGIPYDLILLRRFLELLRYYDYLNILNGIFQFLLNFNFNHRRYGLRPKHRIFSAHATVNDALPNHILSGIVTVKQNVQKFFKNGVMFQNENEVMEIDCVVLGTGYEVKFPFLPDGILQLSESYVNLYKFIFPSQLKHPSLAFIGLTQPIGSFFPISEAQSRWFAQLLKGNVKIPSQIDMEKEIKKRMDDQNKQFISSVRHRLEVLWIPYMDEIYSEIGAKPNFIKMVFNNPRLFISCIFGPCTPYQYRLQGPHAWEGAQDAILSVWKRIEKALQTFKTG